MRDKPKELKLSDLPSVNGLTLSIIRDCRAAAINVILDDLKRNLSAHFQRWGSNDWQKTNQGERKVYS